LFNHHKAYCKRIRPCDPGITAGINAIFLFFSSQAAYAMRDVDNAYAELSIPMLIIMNDRYNITCIDVSIALKDSCNDVAYKGIERKLTNAIIFFFIKLTPT